ncbi:glycoside hydrolase family 2 protein [Pontiella sulfatireligans]|uniref:Beta-galactosidase n=1 Tax=Pontiella sulfatireligans TaxID=2750658 RepID=A0A6C2UJP7_9BACT|nr:glycoside hydrolase family 2 TIM barrel-domain containing protein [Pontiella sulfatireligans]VGO20445.1 Beta-galactosidase [Pontiella sulfatireligans]
MKRSVGLMLLAILGLAGCKEVSENTVSVNGGWTFTRLATPESDATGFEAPEFDDEKWQAVNLPHTAHLEPLVVNDQWQGVCWYRKDFAVDEGFAGKKIFLTLEGAMSSSKVWINGTLVKERAGGYLPVVIDASDFVKPGESNVLAVRLDNQDNPLTGPKPLKRLDFNMYGGLYRNVLITLKDKVYISHPVLANQVAGGGIFVTFPKVSDDESVVNIKTHVVNEEAEAQTVELVQRVYQDGQLVAEQKLEPVTIASGTDAALVAAIKIPEAKLWSPDAPHLHTLKTTVLVDGKKVDSESTRFGIREFVFKDHELYVNGKKTFLRGTNRHQEYPFVGYAMSDNAQYRDAKKIKEAGFNHVRLSHYPQSPAFMDACDELGLITLDAIMGWQYYLDDDQFRNYCYRSATELIRRDRNRPSVLAWEVSLNETKMPEFFMDELNRIVHAEYPSPNVYSAGWMDYGYDIFVQARQHRIMHGYHENLKKPYFVSEYGDWEYYSNNAGLNQDKLDKTLRYETSSRQRRAYGEKRLLKQAYNLQESHNDNLDTSAYGDAYWVMYDYNRGYHDDIEFSGISDIFRIPKFSYSFYKSQKDPSEEVVVDIASYWSSESALDLKVYSNCDEVQLFLNGKLVAKQKPDSDKNCTNLKHPPFTFKLDEFEPGELKAVGLIDEKVAGEHIVKTPGKATGLKIWLDESGKAPEAGCNDTVFAYIAAVDENGTVVPDFAETLQVTVAGDAALMNVGDVQAEAGIATALLQIGAQEGGVSLEAASGALTGRLLFKTK